MQIHHLDEDPANHAAGNLAALCLHCHEETQLKGGFARKLDAAQVRRFRDEWYARVIARRDKADELAAQSMARQVASMAVAETIRLPTPRASLPVADYVELLPRLLRRAYQELDPGSAASTAQMMEFSYEVLDVLTSMLGQLCSYYPPQHFDGQEPKDYISELVASRWRWHRYHLEPSGVGTGGTIVGPSAAMHVIADLESFVVDIVGSLMFGEAVEGDFDLEKWAAGWRAAGQEEVAADEPSISKANEPTSGTCPNCSTPRRPVPLGPIPVDPRSIERAARECTRCGYKLATE